MTSVFLRWVLGVSVREALYYMNAEFDERRVECGRV